MRTAPASAASSGCGGQQIDGMSVGKLIADPELRSQLDAWFAKFAAPGMCNPADDNPTVTAPPRTSLNAMSAAMANASMTP